MRKITIVVVAFLLCLLFTGTEAAQKVRLEDGREVELNQVIVEKGKTMPPSSAVSFEELEKIWQRLSAVTGFNALVIYDGKDTQNAYITRNKNGVYSVVIYLGLLKILRTEDEVAGVLAHEMGHGVNNHLEKARNNTAGIIIGANILGALLGKGTLGEVAVGVGANLAVNGYSREQEVEADDSGVEYLAKAGFNPRGLYNSIIRMSDAGLVTPPSGFNSHPPTERRMTRLRAQAEKWEKKLGIEAPKPSVKPEPPKKPAPKK